ncbi:MAG TPA: hypothetical protein VKI44_42175 [Acetobacteraceae bacterium]|nr:hypothetical protein [Acetobacteraceae bacterium]
MRAAARHRRELLDAGLTDNGGAIWTVTRLVDLISENHCYPDLRHVNNYKQSPHAECSVAAYQAMQQGEPVRIEHVAPRRQFAVAVCEEIEAGASDRAVLAYIKRTFRLVVLTPDEQTTLNRGNRSRLTPDRIAEAGIKLRRMAALIALVLVMAGPAAAQTPAEPHTRGLLEQQQQRRQERAAANAWSPQIEISRHR